MDIYELIYITRKSLKDETHPVKKLGVLYLKLFGESRFSQIAGFVKRYGPEIVLDAICDLYFDPEPHFGKLRYYVKARYLKKKEDELQPELNINLNELLKERKANGK